MLSNAVTLDDLHIPPKNRLEMLGSTASESTTSGGFALNGSMGMFVT
jgi:hypothetical protein